MDEFDQIVSGEDDVQLMRVTPDNAGRWGIKEGVYLHVSDFGRWVDTASMEMDEKLQGLAKEGALGALQAVSRALQWVLDQEP